MARNDKAAIFGRFFAVAEPKLRISLVALYGPDIGREAAADALAYAWQHWERVAEMDNPTGYLFRVGQSRSRLYTARRPPTQAYEPIATAASMHEPGLRRALATLSERQRLVVVMVHAFGYPLAETATIFGLSKSTVQKHLGAALLKVWVRVRLVFCFG